MEALLPSLLYADPATVYVMPTQMSDSDSGTGSIGAAATYPGLAAWGWHAEASIEPLLPGTCNVTRSAGAEWVVNRGDTALPTARLDVLQKRAEFQPVKSLRHHRIIITTTTTHTRAHTCDRVCPRHPPALFRAAVSIAQHSTSVWGVKTPHLEYEEVGPCVGAFAR